MASLSDNRRDLAADSVSRRGFLAIGGTGAMVLLAACAGAPAPATPPKPAAPAPTATPVPTVKPVVISTAVPPTATTAPRPTTAAVQKNAWGKVLPADAAPPAKQVSIGTAAPGGKAMDFNESVYNRAPLADLFTVPLTRIDTDFNIHPGHASSWEVSKDGLTWTFHLKKGLKWTDGNEVTANDYVQTFRHTADPKHAWDFTWYWQGVIKNYTEAVKGKVPTSQIGVRQGADPYTLIFETEVPVPYMPAQLLYSWPLSAAGLEKYGSGVYNTNPKTSISGGPYKLEEWSPDKRVVVGPNPQYQGEIVPLIERYISNLVTGGSNLQRFQAGEVDGVEVFRPDILAAKNNPYFSKLHLYKNPQDFRTYYSFFDITIPPWNKPKVRQAFAHAVDRDSIITAILAPLAMPAYGFLMPGYPSAVQEQLKPLTNYDPAKAKQLLAEAGYPDGKGFPEVTFYVRGSGPPTDPAVTQALAAGWQQVLGVKIKLQTLDSPSFMARLNAKPTKMPFGWVSYGMDYFDASNMLGVWLGGGRHNWNNARYDSLIKEANPLTDQEKRNALYADAQKLLTGDAAGIFVYHQLHGYYYQPYFIGGAYFDKDKYGYDGQEWPGGTPSYGFPSMYIRNDVDKYRRTV